VSRPTIYAPFDNEDDLLAAVREARSRGVPIADVYTPCPVHGLSEAMGLPPSRLSWVTFISGVAGVVGITAFIYWTTAITWPLNIGGKPWNSLPAFMPPIFETMVLAAALTTVAAFFVVARMIPGREPSPFVEGATDDRFVLALEAGGDLASAAAVQAWLAPFHVGRVELRGGER
jgi:hypothetical protein